MAFANTQKCERLADAIKEELAIRAGKDGLLPSDFAVAKGYDANGNVALTLTGTNLSTCFILIVPDPEHNSVFQPSGLTDGLGLTQRMYVPNVIRIGWDTTNAAYPQYLVPILAVCALKGTKVEFYEDAAIALTDLTAGVTNDEFKCSFRDAQWGVMNQQ